MSRKDRFMLITVDTEALPKRAPDDHVNRLMWGRHSNGTAGIGEMVSVGNDFGIRHVFFVDMCGAYAQLDEIRDVMRWLDAAGQDVQLHTHPEYLPKSFWDDHGYGVKPQYMNQYVGDDKAAFVIRHFADLMSNTTGKPVRAHRAGSFRWNASSMRALKAADIPLSFNNSMCAVRAGQCVFSVPTNHPFMWSNGVIEVPMTEKAIFPKVGKDQWWARLTYPESSYFRFNPWWGRLLFNTLSDSPDFCVFLLHSWSLQYWDENGYGVYRDDQRIEGYRKLLARVTKDYDVITTADLLYLQEHGVIQTPRTVDLAQAELPAPTPKKNKGRAGSPA